MGVLPERLSIPVRDDGNCDARNEAEAGKLESEVVEIEVGVEEVVFVGAVLFEGEVLEV